MLSCSLGSSRPFPRRRALRFRARQQFIQVDGSVFRAVFETKGDFRIAQPSLHRGAIRRAKTAAKDCFHGAAQVAPHAVQVTRDAGLMLSEQAANLCEGFLFGVVETKPFPFPWFEFCEGFA